MPPRKPYKREVTARGQKKDGDNDHMMTGHSVTETATTNDMGLSKPLWSSNGESWTDFEGKFRMYALATDLDGADLDGEATALYEDYRTGEGVRDVTADEVLRGSPEENYDDTGDSDDDAYHDSSARTRENEHFFSQGYTYILRNEDGQVLYKGRNKGKRPKPRCLDGNDGKNDDHMDDDGTDIDDDENDSEDDDENDGENVDENNGENDETMLPGETTSPDKPEMPLGEIMPQDETVPPVKAPEDDGTEDDHTGEGVHRDVTADKMPPAPDEVHSDEVCDVQSAPPDDKPEDDAPPAPNDVSLKDELITRQLLAPPMTQRPKNIHPHIVSSIVKILT